MGGFRRHVQWETEIMEESVDVAVAEPGFDVEAAADEAAASRERVNLDNFQEFKDFKSKVNQTIAERDRQAAEQRQYYEAQLQREQEARRRAEEEYEQRFLSEMDDAGQLAYKLEKEQKQRQALEQQLNGIAQERGKLDYMRALQERYGVAPTDDSHPVYALSSVADSLHEEVSKLRAENAKLRKEYDARRAALDDVPDLGSGTPTTPMTDLQSRYNKAMLDSDGRLADEISRAAAERGVALDRFSWLRNPNRR